MGALEMRTWPSIVGNNSYQVVCNFQITASQSAFDGLGREQGSFFGQFYHDRNKPGQGYIVNEFAEGVLEIKRKWPSHPSPSRVQVIEVLRRNQWQLISTATDRDGNHTECATVIDTFVRTWKPTFDVYHNPQIHRLQLINSFEKQE